LLKVDVKGPTELVVTFFLKEYLFLYFESRVWRKLDWFTLVPTMLVLPLRELKLWSIWIIYLHWFENAWLTTTGPLVCEFTKGLAF